MLMFQTARSLAFLLVASCVFVAASGEGVLAQFEPPPSTDNEVPSDDTGDDGPAFIPEEPLSEELMQDPLRNDTIDDQDGSVFTPRTETDPFGVETIEAPGSQTERDQTPNGPVEISDRRATLRALEKVTARIQDLDIGLDETVAFKSLEITLRTCNKRPPEETPETTAFLEIVDNKPDGETESVFTGWMFASSPALNALEHPVYDVWVIDCKISDPAAGTGNL